MRRIGAGCLVPLLLVLSARAEEVVETYDDGTVKAKYVVDEQGRKAGSCVAYWPNGKMSRRAFFAKDALEGSERTFHENGRARTQALYRHGLLHGRFLGWDETGGQTVVAVYADGKLDGKREVYRAGKVASTQVWEHGELLSLEGVAACPKSQEETRRVLGEILDGKSPGGDRASAVPGATPDRVGALRRLTAYRYLCDVPYADLVLGEHENRHADAAAMICSRLGRLSHEPPNPGLPEAEFKAGALGAGSCNLGYGSATESVDGYMDDSDPSNIDRLGHRRWCLNPPMRVTGFGTAVGQDGMTYTAMWSLDRSGRSDGKVEAVCYPPRGWVPVDFFSAGHAWSVSFEEGRFPQAAPEAIHVAVYPLDGDYVRASAPLEADYFRVSNDPYGLPLCIIFRPKGVRVEPGAAYWVEISGLGPKSRRSAGPSFRYLVQFAPAVRAAPADSRDETSK